MRSIILTVLVCVVLGVGLVSSAPSWNGRRYQGGRRRPNVMMRSWRTPWYRDQTLDESVPEWVVRTCNSFERTLSAGLNVGLLGISTKNGYPCMKSQGSLRILTWCKFWSGQPLNSTILPPPENTQRLGTVNTTVVDTRPSYIPTCKIYDVTLEAFESDCYIMLIDGLLLCADEDQVQPEYQTVTLYPTFTGGSDRIIYKICSKAGGLYCPGPAKLPSLIEPEEEIMEVNCAYQGGCGRR